MPEQIIEEIFTEGKNPIRDYIESNKKKILSKKEEVELGKKILNGTMIIHKIISVFPLTKRISNSILKSAENKDIKKKSNKLLIISEIVEKTIKELKKLVCDIDKIEKETGKKIAEFNLIWDKILEIYNIVERSKEKLILKNLRLVINIAKKRRGKWLQVNDLIQEGSFGLMKAVNGFDYRKGYKFSTYATWWIRQFITRALADQSRTIRIPIHMVEIINKLEKVSIKLKNELERKPKTKEIAEKMNIPEEKVDFILKISRDTVSLDSPIGSEEEVFLQNFLKDTNSIMPIDDAMHNELKKQIETALSTLPKKEADIITDRFGIETGCEKTLEEISKKHKVTRERIRQLQNKALKKLRHPSNTALNDFRKT